MSEFRYCKQNRKWILFAPNRLKRPYDFKSDEIESDIKNCPFEVGNEHLTPKEIYRISDEQGWKCRVVPNLYNALFIEKEPLSHRDGYFEKYEGFGAHEVIIETPNHKKMMYQYSASEFNYYLLTIQNRLKELKKDIRIKYISIFKNSGKQAGATLHHSHSQLIALPFIPKQIMDEFEYKKEYSLLKHRTLFDDLIYDEMMHKKNIIYECNFFIAYTPYASEFPFEVIITTKIKKPSLIFFDKALINQLAKTMQVVYTKMHSVIGEFSYNMIINNAPFMNMNEKELANIYRFHIKILPRLYNIAGFELSSGIYINPVLPEVAAKALREVK